MNCEILFYAMLAMLKNFTITLMNLTISAPIMLVTITTNCNNTGLLLTWLLIVWVWPASLPPLGSLGNNALIAAGFLQ